MIVRKVSPRRALIDFYAFMVALALVSLLVGLIVYGRRAGSDALTDKFLVIATIVVLVLFLSVSSLLIETELLYGDLVRRWKKLTRKDAGCFPLDPIECSALRKKFFIGRIEFSARCATVAFKHRDSCLDETRLLGRKPAIDDRQFDDPKQLLDFRNEFARKAGELVGRENYYKFLKRRANLLHRLYLAWWDLAKDIGKFYGANLLPVQPNTNKCFNDPDEFRKYIAEKDYLARTPPDPMHDK